LLVAGGSLIKRFRFSVPLLAAVLIAAAGLSSLSAKRVELAMPQRYLDDVKYLASPELQGRGAGTKGLETAGEYIAAAFRKAGLKPAGEDGSFWQSFKVTTNAKPGKDNQLAGPGGALTINTDYMPMSFSSNGQAAGGLVFVGYGITAPELHYDDYAGVDVKDKIVVMLRYEPPQFHAKSGGNGRENAYTHHAHLVSKAINARDHGAKALILVNGFPGTKNEDKLIRFGTVSGPENAGILMLQATNNVVNGWLKPAGKSLADIQSNINSKREPASFALPSQEEVRVRVDIERDHATVRNVVGYRPGSTDEYIIIGAHYDHLGLGNESSLAPSKIGQVHPGADDNASGTAGVLELARMFSGQEKQKRGILFIAFSGEEIGLLGSSEWANHPTVPLKSAVAMLNMDMIGRVKGSKLYIGGTGTGSTFEPMLKKITGNYDFKLDYSQDGFSASDHTSFAAKSIPVLFFFSGLHADYHKPSDTWDKIDSKDAAEVVDLVYDIAMQLANDTSRPQFVKVQPNPHAGGVPGGGGGSGYGPYFGSIPDFAPIEKGVKFSDVRAGSPAGKAGLQAGDILIGFGDKPVNNLYDFTFALRASKVGDVVKVKYIRDGKEMTADVKLEARQ